jgi:glyceraldehyde-3-phosphate dehydrogenase/erythrose-4-phosphate dehydrogenase
MSWYDNEWGYANQMVREALSVTNVHALAEQSVVSSSPTA